MEEYTIGIGLGCASIVAGFIFIFAILKLLPILERREILSQKKAVLEEAQRQQNAILSDARQQAEENERLMLEDLEASIVQQGEDLKAEEANATAQGEYFDQEERRLAKIEAHLEEKARHLETIESEVSKTLTHLEGSRGAVISSLENVANLDAASSTTKLANQYREHRRLEAQKVLKSLQEELHSSSRKRAQRALARVHARYAPNFVWPKSVNVVEVPSEKVLEQITQESCTLVEHLSELSGASIKLIPSGNDQRGNGIMKFAGGFGIYRESARLCLADLITQSPSNWNKAQNLYQKHKMRLEAEAEVLGKKAIDQLELNDIHPEIQKLVGALNWRTSYRQNQWHHTVEVAVFAGILASELGVDPIAAKRVGLLHDIGKAIDYRIEGSHAVISGDYADRYGESRLICDTVMSHHADLLVESALAYVLRAADTLSGARPGARVNLEEGYQIRLDAIALAVRSFRGISDLAIMNGGREVHIQVNHKQVSETEVQNLGSAIARKIEEDVAYPGQIKILLSRSFESNSVA